MVETRCFMVIWISWKKIKKCYEKYLMVISSALGNKMGEKRYSKKINYDIIVPL